MRKPQSIATTLGMSNKLVVKEIAKVQLETLEEAIKLFNIDKNIDNLKIQINVLKNKYGI
jgi:ribosomal protein S13